MAMRALVTGATGFLGSHLCRALLNRGFDVGVIVRPESDGRRLADLRSQLHVMPADLTSLEAVSDRFQAFAPDVVFHLGWFGVTNRYRNDPAQIPENVAATLAVLRQSVRARCRLWIGLGSQAEYGVCDRPITEDTSARPQTTYGAAKLAACLAAREICEAGGMAFAWLRLFSCYGPDDNASWLIPSLILQLLRGERPALTAGVQRWDYLYVDDAVQAIVDVAGNPRARGILNLASGQAVPVRRIAERIRDLIDPALPLGFGEVPYRPDQIMHLEGDVSRLRATTGWSPQHDLESGLRKTIAWYRQHARLARVA